MLPLPCSVQQHSSRALNRSVCFDYQSTLLNALVGKKVSIATSKAQTTRRETLGVLTEANVQLVRCT